MRISITKPITILILLAISYLAVAFIDNWVNAEPQCDTDYECYMLYGE